MSIEIIDSPLYAAQRSPLYELNPAITAPTLTIQELSNYKFRPGAQSQGSNTTGDPISGPWGPTGGMWRPGVTFRTNFRNTYTNVAWSYDSGPLSPHEVYTSSGSLGTSASGFTPSVASEPNLTNYPPTVGSNVASPASWFYNYNVQLSMSASWASYPGAIQPFSSYTGLTLQSGLGEVVGVTLSSIVPFATHLAMSSTRIQARAYGGTVAEFFGEYPATTSLGTWNAGGKGTDGDPYFGANSITNAVALWSGWYWPTSEETGGEQAVDGMFQQGFGMSAHRCRFQVSTSSPYFVVRATVLRFPSFSPYPTNSDYLTDLVLLDQGTLAPATWYDIPYPTGVPASTDFITSAFPSDGTATLSCGCICFAIVGEYPLGWQGRTGFIL